MSRSRTGVALVAALVASAGCSHSSSPGLRAGDAWVRPTAPGVDSAAFYLRIDNDTANADVLLGGEAPPCLVLSVHLTTTDSSGVAVMSEPGAHASEIAAGATLDLSPDGLHLMCYGLTEPLLAGERIDVTLHFRSAPDVRVVAIVADR